MVYEGSCDEQARLQGFSGICQAKTTTEDVRSLRGSSISLNPPHFLSWQEGG